MANTMRWRYGATNPVMMRVAAETEIEIGDLVVVDDDFALPAASIDLTDAATNRAAVHDTLLGVAMQASGAGDTAAVRVATTGVFEFDAPADDYEVGQLIGAEATDAATANQTVTGVSTIAEAIGRCAKRGDGTSSVLVDIVSSIVKGGPQAIL